MINYSIIPAILRAGKTQGLPSTVNVTTRAFTKVQLASASVKIAVPGTSASVKLGG